MTASREVRNLSGQLNHDLREPINSIRRKLELLETSKEAAAKESIKAREISAYVSDVGKHCTDIINGIRALRNDVISHAVDDGIFLNRLQLVVADASKLSTFVARNPLTVPGTSLIDDIRTTALRFQKMLRALTTIARTESPVFQQTNYKNQANIAAGYVTERLPKDLETAIDGPFFWTDSKASGIADQGMFLTIFQNIYDNSVKYYSPARPLQIRTTFEEIDESEARNRYFLDEVQLPRSPRYVIITVRDNGIGMPGDGISKIFDPYHQLASGRAMVSGVRQRDHQDEDVADTGIGLYTVRKLVAAHSGYVLAESDGSTYSAIVIIVPVDPRIFQNIVKEA